MSGRPNTKWIATMVRKLGSREAVTEWARKIGTIGGKVSCIKGFAANRELASRAGRIGGRISRRRPAIAREK